MALLAAAIADLWGGLLDIPLAFIGRRVDDMVMRLFDALLAVPGLLMVLLSAVALGTGFNALILTLGYACEFGWAEVWDLPVVAETWDSWLNDMAAFHVTKDHIYQATESARSGPVAEGNISGGTGMICHEFKGGIGTASRMVTCYSGA